MIKCPFCKGKEVYYRQQVLEYHTVESIEEDGSVNLYSFDDSFPLDDPPPVLFCFECEKEISIKKYLDLIKE
jgi:hypothetical protein